MPRENSTSDSEENSAVKDSDQQSVGDTDNQVCNDLVKILLKVLNATCDISYVF